MTGSSDGLSPVVKVTFREFTSALPHARHDVWFASSPFGIGGAVRVQKQDFCCFNPCAAVTTFFQSEDSGGLHTAAIAC